MNQACNRGRVLLGPKAWPDAHVRKLAEPYYLQFGVRLCQETPHEERGSRRRMPGQDQAFSHAEDKQEQKGQIHEETIRGGTCVEFLFSEKGRAFVEVLEIGKENDASTRPPGQGW